MNNDQPSHHSPPPDTPSVDAQEARIAFLFRTTQRQGRIHPLQHPLQQHRAAQAAEASLATRDKT
jgi:hypothetical protein